LLRALGVFELAERVAGIVFDLGFEEGEALVRQGRRQGS